MAAFIRNESVVREPPCLSWDVADFVAVREEDSRRLGTSVTVVDLHKLGSMGV